MSRIVLLATLALGAAQAVGELENRLYQRNPVYQDPNDPRLPNYDYYTPDPYLETFTIHHGIEGEPFEFEAALIDPLDPNEANQGPGDISSITADPNSGPVTITVLHPRPSQPPTYGARVVWNIDLKSTADGVLGTIGEVRVANVLTNPLDPATGVRAETITGPIVVDGGIPQEIHVTYLGGDITCATLGNLIVTGPPPPNPFSPSISIGSSYAKVMDIHGGLQDLSIAGQLSGTVGVTYSVVLLHATSVAGTITVGGNLDELLIDGAWGGTATIANLCHAEVGADITASIVVGSNQDCMSSVMLQAVGDLDGTVHTLGNQEGLIDVANLDGALEVDLDLGPYGVGIDGDLNGMLHARNIYAPVIIYGNLSGAIEAEQSITDGGDGIYVTGDFGGSISTGTNLSALVDVLGRMGDPNVPGELCPGHIKVNGSLTPANPNFPLPRIWVHTAYDANDPTLAIGPNSYLSIDYDGWQASDEWSPMAEVVIGDPNDPNDVYTANTPSRRLWHITECRGDMDNDGTVGVQDINPFIMALNDATYGTSSYAGAFPGLQGSMIYHGDATCDVPPHLGVEDITPFSVLVSSGCCDPNCPGCPPGGDGMEGGMAYGEDGGLPGMPSPEEFAAQLAANVWPELYDGLLSMVLAAIDAAPDEGTQAYWQAVYAALTQ